MRKRYHTIKEKQFERMKRDENNRIFVEKTVSAVKMPPTYTKPFPHTGILYAAAKHFPCILIFILSLSMSGCAAFSKKEFRRDYTKIPKNNISLLNGTYKIYPAEKYGEQTPFSAADSLKRYYNLYNTITGKTVMDKDTVQDVIDQYTVNITVTDRKEIKIYLIREGHVLGVRQFSLCRHFYFFNDRIFCITKEK